ncbi:unnamed protein product [Paramecium octaurelia]|uniref:Uncharacterized protein n=1 Tax=Paramecium octaurelia TaxID=43137 RepID=A0A8S1YL53_PAROT|nr:unnamed protein product [Paramecium octaurelia]
MQSQFVPCLVCNEIIAISKCSKKFIPKFISISILDLSRDETENHNQPNFYSTKDSNFVNDIQVVCSKIIERRTLCHQGSKVWIENRGVRKGGIFVAQQSFAILIMQQALMVFDMIITYFFKSSPIQITPHELQSHPSKRINQKGQQLQSSNDETWMDHSYQSTQIYKSQKPIYQWNNRKWFLKK